MKPKPTFTRRIAEREWSWTILALAYSFGAAARLLPALLVDFPINDGGMFAVMIRDLIANGYSLPLLTSYNHAGIPYVYPPLGFYFGAFLRSLGISAETLFLWAPAVFSAAILPAFYYFVREIASSRPHAAAATAFLALAPGTYAWYLMGGGLTRAPGTIFLLLSLTFTLRAFRQADWKPVLLSSLFCGLALLTHPQAALLTLTGCGILWLIHGRSRRGILRAAIIAAGAALLSAPWWALVLSRHGVETLLSAGQSGDLHASLSAWLASLTYRQTILPFSTLFRLLGLGWILRRRRFDIFLLGMMPYFIDQRSAPIVSAYVNPLLASYGFINALPALLVYFREKRQQVDSEESLFNRPAFSIGLLGIIFYLFIESLFHTTVILPLSLPPSARGAMTWINQNAPPDAGFLILTGREDAMTDPAQEWFPALAGRRSATTLQGIEWVDGKIFYARWAQLDSLQACADAACVLSRAETYGLKFDDILLNRNLPAAASFEEEGWEIVFQNDDYAVLTKRRAARDSIPRRCYCTIPNRRGYQYHSTLAAGLP